VVYSDRFSLCDLISYLSNEISMDNFQISRISVLDKYEGGDVKLVFES
jgi:hypothetical protein